MSCRECHCLYQPNQDLRKATKFARAVSLYHFCFAPCLPFRNSSPPSSYSSPDGAHGMSIYPRLRLVPAGSLARIMATAVAVAGASGGGGESLSTIREWYTKLSERLICYQVQRLGQTGACLLKIRICSFKLIFKLSNFSQLLSEPA